MPGKPIVGLLSSSAGLTYGVSAAMLWLCQFLFLLMFWPNQRFNSGFPFHIRTSQMSNTTERAAQEDLDRIQAQLKEAGLKEGDDAEIMKRMQEIRAATNPLTRVRLCIACLSSVVVTPTCQLHCDVTCSPNVLLCHAISCPVILRHVLPFCWFAHGWATHSKSRVILEKMQGNIGNMMMFSTELGRALEEMQTKDDDPESGEEVGPA